jgi:signal transduction histidine kinase
MSRHTAPQGPSQSELRMKAELDKARRDVIKLKKELAAGGGAAAGAMPAPPPLSPAPLRADEPAVAGAAAPATLAEAQAEIEVLRGNVAELTATRQRLSRLYFASVEENRRRAKRLHQILESIAQVNSELDLDALLARIAGSVSASLGFRVVRVLIREPGSDRLRVRASAGVGETGPAQLEDAGFTVEEFGSWLGEDARVSRSYFVLDPHGSGRPPAAGGATRAEWEWREGHVLLVPMRDRDGELAGCFSVDDPADRLVPSTETVELLEIFGNHTVAALENARLYQALAAQTRQLKESGLRVQELHALKTNFVSTVSHELRTPLTAIRAFLDTLLASADAEIPRDRLRHFLGVMNEETQRLARLIESVLDLNRFDSGDLRMEHKLVDLADVVQDIVRLLEPVAETGQVTLKLVNDCADTRLDADPDQMRQLALHLGSNAVKFTPAGGAVTVFLSGSADEIALRVEDTGIGIPEAALEKVFERFYQVDSSLARRFGGAGIGLAVCKSIVEWHGGRITAESAPGRGSCFTVVLPRRSAPRVALRSDPSALPASEDLLRLAIEMVAEVMDARAVSLLAPGPDGSLTVRAAIGLDPGVMRETRVEAGAGVAGWVATHRRPVCAVDGVEPGGIAGSGRERYRTRTFLSVPVGCDDGRLLGVLNVTDPVSGKDFDAEDCELLLHLAERVGATWAALEGGDGGPSGDDTARAVRQLRCAFERQRLEAPGRVRLARALAHELGLGEADVATIAFAAGVHDIGMARLPGSLRDCASPFSPDERALMESHVELGAELLKPLETVGAVREIVLSHHEWWDGTGYPRALRGDEIPIGARILAVVDAWESMTVGRAHRPARNEQDARLELGRLAGRQFDPRVTEAFERVLEAARQPAAPAGSHATDDANAIARR